MDIVIPDRIKSLKPYQPGRPVSEVERELGIEGVIKLASNENPLGPSPKAISAAAECLRESHLYPDGAAFHLRKKLASRLKVDEDRIVFGAGADELIHMVVKAFCRLPDDEVLSHEFAFISYKLSTVSMGLRFVESQVDEDFRCDVDSLIKSITSKTKVIFIANPNNPTGCVWTRKELEYLLANVPRRVVLVLDEAYHEFADYAVDDYPSASTYTKSHPNLISLRTFSKIYGLAGMRVGYALCNHELADYINRVRGPFNVNSIAQHAAIAALDDETHVKDSARRAKEGIEHLSTEISKMGGTPIASAANFVLMDVKQPSVEVTGKLLKKGIIVRPMHNWGLDSFLRISIGTEHEMERAVSALKDVLLAP